MRLGEGEGQMKQFMRVEQSLDHLINIPTVDVAARRRLFHLSKAVGFVQKFNSDTSVDFLSCVITVFDLFDGPKLNNVLLQPVNGNLHHLVYHTSYRY
ncbi:hypothetical protein RRG08_021579 [Elysia crispata]|uniref:Uncharacterized protein n=1 Tax=Elysia crispata TaxID=231223 RepID=A0AAE1CER8_9GAST|nr:hypothetical protein RRG08_021579 [Elysia crispata]